MGILNSRFMECLRQGVADIHYAKCLKGKDSPDPPDYTPMANASREAAEIGAQLGREQLAENRRQYEQNSAALKPVLDAQLGIMRDSQKAAAEDRAYTLDTFRPLETGLVKDAQDFSEAGAQEQFARSAVSDVEQAQANEEAQATRSMTAMGVNPNSGRFAGLKRSMGIMNAAQRAGAATNARVQGSQLATAKKMEAAGLGRNLAATTQGSNQVALSGASGATNSTMAPGAQLLNGMSAGNGTIMQGQGMKIQGLGNVLNAQSSNYNAALSANASEANGAMGAFGTVAGAALMMSSKEVKEDKSPIDGNDIVSGLQRIPVEKWRYKEGVADGGEHIGPYAEDVQREFGDSVAPEGKAIDLVSMNGITLAAVKNLANRVNRIEKRPGLKRA